METALELLAARAGKAPVRPRGAEQANRQVELTSVPQKKPRAKKSEVRPLPSREEILAFVAEHPGKAGKREIARAFGISGGDRIALKQMLRELDEGGLVQKHRGRLERPGDLPAVAVLTITARDSDGEFLAEPAEWREDGGPPPKGIVARRPQARRAGAGHWRPRSCPAYACQVGWARLHRSRDQDSGAAAGHRAGRGPPRAGRRARSNLSTASKRRWLSSLTASVGRRRATSFR